VNYTTSKNSPARLLAAALALTVLAFAPTRDAWAQATYPTAEAAAEAFTAALEHPDPEKTKVMLGEDWKQFIPAAGIKDEYLQRYLAAWEKAHAIIVDDDGRTMVAVGDEGWTLPIPLVQSDDGWSFDVLAGADEMRTRLIGRNELSAIDAVHAYVDAQREYAQADRNGDDILQYAQRVVSTPGQKDGLYWARLDDEEESPLGPLFGEDEPGTGYHGYFFRILDGQGPAAPGGAFSYMLGGRMVGGFALIAWPIRWDDTGVMTFTINYRGTAYQTNLGPETDKLAREILLFDPDEAWTEVDD